MNTGLGSLLDRTALCVLLLLYMSVQVGSCGGTSYTELGAQFFGMRRFADALGALRKALKVNPRDDKALYYMGMVFLNSKNHERAVDYFEKSFRINHDNHSARDELIKLRLAMARQYKRDGNIADALGELRKLFKAGILSLEAADELMRIYDAKRAYKKIIDLGEKLNDNRHITVGDDYVWGNLWYYMGLAARKMKLYGKAEEYLNNAVNSVREHPNARAAYEQVKLIQRKRLLPLLRSADGLAKKGRYAEALLKYRSALKIDEDDPQLTARIEKVKSLIEARNLVDRAVKMEQDGLWTQARELLERAAEKSPGDPDILVRLKRVRKTQKRLARMKEEADKLRRQAERAEEEKFNEFYRKGRSAYDRREYSAAVDWLRKAARMRPDDRIVSELLETSQKKARLYEKFSAGLKLYRKKAYNDAIRQFTALEKLDPDFRGLKKYLARCFMQTGQFEKAEQNLHEHLSKYSRDVEARYLLAEIYRLRGRDDKAALRRALSMYLEVRDLEPGFEDSEKYIAELSWEVNKSKYFLVVLVVLLLVGGFAYSKVRPTLLRKTFLKGLERNAARKSWQAVKAQHDSLKEIKLSAMEEAQARYIFATAFFETGGYSRCIKECQELMRLRRLTKKARSLLARSYWAMQTISPEVLDLYMDLLNEERDNESLRLFIGKFCAAKKIVNPATLPLLKQLAMQNPDDEGLRNMLVRSCLKNKDRGPSAMSIYRLEAEHNPENVDVRAVIAEELLKAGKLEETIKECEECINIRLNHRPTHEVLVAAYEKMGRLDELARTYQSILEHDPHNAVINHYLQKILHPDGPPVDAPGTVAGAERPAECDWTDQMPAAFGIDASAVEHSEQGTETASADGSTVTCSHCGRAVAAGSYFCECGQPL